MSANKTQVVTEVSEQGGPKYRVNLTIDWEGMTEAQYQALSTRHIVVFYGNKMRGKASIPATDEVKAVDWVPGHPRQRSSSKLSYEDHEAAILAETDNGKLRKLVAELQDKINSNS